MTIEHAQNLVIGSGVAGKILAWTLAKQGQKTGVVERSMVGGMPYTALRDAIFTHPTTAEGLVGLFANPSLGPRAESSLSRGSVKGGPPADKRPGVVEAHLQAE